MNRYEIICIYNKSTDDSEYMNYHNEYEDERIEFQVEYFYNIENTIKDKYEKNTVFIEEEILNDIKYFFENELNLDKIKKDSEIFNSRETLGYSVTDCSLEIFITILK